MSSVELERAQTLRADIEAGAAEAEVQRCVNTELINQLNAAGLFALTIPAKFGGAQLPALDGLKVLEELSYADSAVGWCGMTGAPPVLTERSPEAARALSRIVSALKRKRGARARYLFSGSRSRASAVIVEARR